MSNLTYEYDNRCELLETYEWDNVWWEHADVKDVPRVLYIGDSISCATRIAATALSQHSIYFDGFGTSKAADNPHFADSIRLFASQQGERKIILFNNGLHGWHLDDTTGYANAYERMIVFLQEEFKGTPLVLLLTTHVADSERDGRVVLRNKAVCELASRYGIPVIDLYTVSKQCAELLSPDGVHFTEQGYRVLAQEILDKIAPFFGCV